MITPIIINRLKWKAYLIFTVTNLVFIPIIYFFYPETSNFELEEIDFIFSGSDNPIATAKQMQKDRAQGRGFLVPDQSSNSEKVAGLGEEAEHRA